MDRREKTIIGITGGVGAGKSSVLAILQENFGARVLLADPTAQRLMEPGTEGLSRVTEALGDSFLLPDGSVDKNKLADLIFHDEQALQTMNAIIHPMVWEVLKKEAMEAAESLVVIEAAVFHTAPVGLFDEIWYVYASEEVRIQRLMESRGYTREKCRRIIAGQASEDWYRDRSDRVIDNNGTASRTEKQLKEILCHEVR